MNYQKIYNQIIDRAKDRELNCYKENHHIIPRCMGGTNLKDNLVALTAREHFISHWLLTRIYPENKKLVRAFWGMCNQKNKGRDYRVSSKAYEESKIAFSKIQSVKMLGSNNPQYNKIPWNKGIPASESSNKKRSQALSGENHFMFGKHHTEDTIQKLKRPKTQEHIEAMKGPRKPYGPQVKVICPYCNKQGGNSMRRWHFENCKNKELQTP